MSRLKKDNTKQRSAFSVSSSVKTTADKQGLGDNNIPPLKIRGGVGGVMNGVNDGVLNSGAGAGNSGTDEQAFIDYARVSGVQLEQFIAI